MYYVWAGFYKYVTEGFNDGQSLDDGMSPSHSDNPQSKSDGHHDW